MTPIPGEATFWRMEAERNAPEPAPRRPHDTGSDPLTPGPATAADVTIERMYYTLCQVCRQPFNDWSDTYAEARRKRAAHLAWHKRSVEAAPVAAREED